MSIGSAALAPRNSATLKWPRLPRWRGPLHSSDLRWAIAFLVPYTALFAAFVVYPMAYGLWMGSDPALYAALLRARIDTLYDDRADSPGAKFAAMDLIGLPWQLVVGPRSLQRGMVEVKNRRTGQREDMTAETAINHLRASL